MGDQSSGSGVCLLHAALESAGVIVLAPALRVSRWSQEGLSALTILAMVIEIEMICKIKEFYQVLNAPLGAAFKSLPRRHQLPVHHTREANSEGSAVRDRAGLGCCTSKAGRAKCISG